LRLIKPLRVSFIHRVFDHRKKHVFVATVGFCFPFDKPKAPVSETEMWRMVASDLGRFGVLDYWMFKPRGEVLVTGSCFTGEREKGSEFVRLVVGPQEKRLIDKKLYVFGDRKWTLIGASEPQMFSRMPIDYGHAFGGEKFPHNPIGKGLAPTKDESGAEVHWLPNVEDPKNVLKSKGDRPQPASFAPWDLTWPEHFEKKMGTYTRDWVEKNGHALADDVDFSLFNVAAPDQRIEKWFEGDEEIRVENMHPDRRIIETKLPRFFPRCFVKMKASVDPEQKLTEIPLSIDTVHVFPHRERVIVLARGLREITTMDASDVELAVAALDDDQKRPIEHYIEVIAKRSDKEKGALYALRDRDMMPVSAELTGTSALKVDDPLEDVPKPEGLAQLHFAERARREFDKARQQFLEQGVDEALLPPPPPPPTPQKPIDFDDLPEIVEKAMKEKEKNEAETKKQQAQAEEQLQAFAKEYGVDLPALRAKTKGENKGPPKFSADAEIERMRDLLTLAQNANTDIPGLREKLDDPNLRAQLLEAEAQLIRAYRLSAHSQEPADAMNDEQSQAARDELKAILTGTPRQRRDFTGANLAGMDLSNVDLEGAFLEGANLKGANLTGAKLKDAVLAHANLEGARFTKADLRGANLGNAKLLGTNLEDADLEDAILYDANLAGARLCRAKLSNANTLQMKADGADFTGVVASRLMFMKGSLRGAIFRGARIEQSVFFECDASGMDAAASDFSQTVFLMSKGDGASFADAKVENFRVVQSSFEKANFAKAAMPGSNLRGAKLAGANFSGVNLRRSDLSAADMRGVNFEDGIAVECLMLDTVLEDAKMGGANLMLAIMHRAILRGADVSNANLFCADLTGAVGDKRTSFSGSNVKRALVAGVFHGG
jgi:uncharacterized protein YjbI with pentapeptide repeats